MNKTSERMKFLRTYNCSIGLVLALVAALLPQSVFASFAELHAHLFMKEGMTWAFRGDFNGPLEATSWKDRFSSQANPEALEKSGLSVVVATIYAHPLF